MSAKIIIIPLKRLEAEGMTLREIQRCGSKFEKGYAIITGPGPGYNRIMDFLGKSHVANFQRVATGNTISNIGPILWADLHRWAMHAILEDAPGWLERFAGRVPCGQCRTDWKILVRGNPPDCSSHEALFAWTVDRHNDVNVNLGKPVVGVEEARELYSSLDAKGKPIPVIVRLIGGLGDATAFSGALRDLHAAFPRKYRIEVRHWSAPELYKDNPHAAATSSRNALIGHFIERVCNVPTPNYGDGSVHLQILYQRELEHALGIRWPTTKLGGDLRLSPEEKTWEPPWPTDLPVCILNAGSKGDFTVKQSDPGQLQSIVDRLRGKITFVLVGGADHTHPRIKGAYDFVRTHKDNNFRWTMRAMYRADMVVSPVSWPMHLAAGLELPPEKNGRERLCVVLGGGRENPGLTKYPGHIYLHTIGQLDCCKNGPCWKMRTDLDCLNGTNVSLPLFDGGPLRVAKCMTNFADHVVSALLQFSEKMR